MELVHHDSINGWAQSRHVSVSFGTKAYGIDYQRTFVDVEANLGTSIRETFHERTKNEDALFVTESAAMLCDGVGGSKRGGLAAIGAIDTAVKEWSAIYNRTIQAPATFLRTDRIEPKTLATRVMRASHEAAKRERGTCTAAFAAIFTERGTKQKMLYHANVGDSRIYLLSEGKLYQLSEDDSLITLLTREPYKGFPMITRQEAYQIDQSFNRSMMSSFDKTIFNQRNGITQSMGEGSFKQLDLHIGTTPVYSEDTILLCSDGLSDNLLDVEIKNILQDYQGWEIVEQLMLACDARIIEQSLRSKPDDISCVVLELL